MLEYSIVKMFVSLSSAAQLLTEVQVYLAEEELARYPRQHVREEQEGLEVTAGQERGNLPPYFCREPGGLLWRLHRLLGKDVFSCKAEMERTASSPSRATLSDP